MPAHLIRGVCDSVEAPLDVDERIESHAKQRAKELKHTLARERASSQHALIEQERELAEARGAYERAAGLATDEAVRRWLLAQRPAESGEG